MGAGGKVPQMKSDPATLANLAKSRIRTAHPPAAPASSSKTQTQTQTQTQTTAPAAGTATLASDTRAAYMPLSNKDRYTMNMAGSTSRLAFAGRANSNNVPATVVDRVPHGAPTWGIDSLNRDVIREFEKQDDRYSFWGREGGWRNICGARQVRVCDSLQHTATHCNMLQHTATCCNTLQHAATRCNIL